MGWPLPSTVIFQGPVTVAYKDQFPALVFPNVLDSKSCGNNYGLMIIKHYHRVLNTCLQTINGSSRIESKAVPIFDGCTSHLNIYMIKDLGIRWYGGPDPNYKHLTRDQRGGSGEFWYRKDIISKC